MKFALLLLAAACLVPGAAIAGDFPELSGPWFGQEPPGEEAELFAPGLVSNGLLNRDVAMMPDGSEIYFCVATAGYRVSAILVTKIVDGRWTEPEVAPFAATRGWANLEPAISPDGQRFFFLSDRPDGDEEAGDSDIWAMDREGDGWSEPYNLGEPINTDGQEFYPSVTDDGTLYFTRAAPGTRIHNIYRSRLVDGVYQEPELLPEQVNCGRNRFNAFVAQDESYVIVPAAGMEDTLGGVDYYITFRDDEDRWTEPLNMGAPVSSESGNEWSASVSPCGQVLFFMSARQADEDESPLTYAKILELQDVPENGDADIYWVSASILDDLRAKAYGEE